MTDHAVLRIEPVAAGDVDAALCRLPWLRLVRADEGTFLACALELAGAARVLLARSGVTVEPRDALPLPPKTLVPARALDLMPVALSGIVDSLELRVLAPGEAAARLRRRGLFRRGRPDLAGLRAVLHGDDRLFGWRRVVWADRTLLGAHQLRRTRPIVFDRDAVTRGAEGCILAGAGAIGRWMRT